MKKSKFTEEQITGFLQQAEAGVPIKESFVKRRTGVAVANGDNTDQARERAKLAAGKVRPIKP